MELLIEVIEFAVLLFLKLLGYVILARCILSFFASEDSKVMEFCYAVSEPVVAPVRNLLDRIPSLGGSGIDFSYMVTFLILTILETILLSVT